MIVEITIDDSENYNSRTTKCFTRRCNNSEVGWFCLIDTRFLGNPSHTKINLKRLFLFAYFQRFMLRVVGYFKRYWYDIIIFWNKNISIHFVHVCDLKSLDLSLSLSLFKLSIGPFHHCLYMRYCSVAAKNEADAEYSPYTSFSYLEKECCELAKENAEVENSLFWNFFYHTIIYD